MTYSKLIDEQLFKITTFQNINNNDILDFINDTNMTEKLANQLISDWNGKDSHFLSDGDIYTEDDVNKAFEYLQSKKKEINYKLAFLSILGIIACIITAIILNP